MNRVGRKQLIILGIALCLLAASGLSQSTVQDHPTPVLTNEISGSIKPRTIGDARLTTHYYTFNGEQGDVFINIVTRNLNGDIDVFTVNGLRPITKISVYADYGENETGRAVYFRKPEKLILRVQGRTPNDDEASYRIKFAGSFAAIRPEDVKPVPEVPRVTQELRQTERGLQVDKAEVAVAEPAKDPPPEEKAPKDAKPDIRAELPAEQVPPQTEKDAKEEPLPDPVPDKKAEVIATDPLTKKEDTEVDRSVEPNPAEPKVDAAENKTKTLAPPRPERRTRSARPTPPGRKKAEAPPDPLESINLVIVFKDGNSLERRLSEVRRFSVDQGMLVVVLKSGTTSRYPIANVAKVTIE